MAFANKNSAELRVNVADNKLLQGYNHHKRVTNSIMSSSLYLYVRSANLSTYLLTYIYDASSTDEVYHPNYIYISIFLLAPLQWRVFLKFF